MSLFYHLDKLHAFKVVAESGKIHEAAKRLNITQPALTRTIQNLENVVQRKLFYRSRNGVTLTESGKLLFEFSQSLSKQLEDFEERLKFPKEEFAGLLRIGSYESLAEYFWPDFIASLKKTHPELKLSIKTNNISNNLKDLESGQLDMLVDAEPRVVGDFSSWVLYRDHFNFYGKKSAIPNNLTPETIEKIPLVSCPSAFDQENKTILYHLEEKGYYFKEKIELDSFTAVATFCKKGLGLGVLPQKLAASSVESGKLAEITLKGFSQKGFGIHSICATAKSDSTDNPRIRFLLKLLKNWFK